MTILAIAGAFGDPLTWIRAIHYASLIQLVGVFAFLSFVAEPALADARDRGLRAGDRLHRLLLRLAWLSLAVALLSGALWLTLVAADMSGQPFNRILPGGIAGKVLTQTDFGRVWELRLAMTGLLAGCLLRLARPGPGPRRTVARNAALLLSAANLAALAWAGHARDTAGFAGAVHLPADVVHLLTAGAWLGGLVPLALLFSLALQSNDPALGAVARSATLRFSVMGIVCVLALFTSGVVNTWFLVGSIPNLALTGYGRLLMIKIGLFFVMIGIAAFNRFRLTPGLLGRPTEVEHWRTLRHLRRNSLTEAGLGLVLLIIVGALGISTPAIDAMMLGMP